MKTYFFRAKSIFGTNWDVRVKIVKQLSPVQFEVVPVDEHAGFTSATATIGETLFED